MVLLVLFSGVLFSDLLLWSDIDVRSVPSDDAVRLPTGGLAPTILRLPFPFSDFGGDKGGTLDPEG